MNIHTGKKNRDRDIYEWQRKTIYIQKKEKKNEARTNIYCTQGRVAYVNE